jgi:subtilase family serine protease
MSAHRRRGRAFHAHLDRLDDRCLLSSFTPAQIDQAYGVNSFHFVSSNGQSIAANGAGETIAIVDAYHDPYLASDLQTFDKQFNLPNPQLSQWSYTTQSNDNWAQEETLDVEWAHAIAPDAKIDVVEAASSNMSDLFNAVNFARNQPGVVAVSMSFGGPEFAGETADDSLFTTPAGHTGITFIASSGDKGAAPGVEYPAASPNVLGVGGTSLYVNAAGNYLGETGWNNSLGAGGGGYSRYEAEPSYQTGVQRAGVRTVPDVSLDADPNTGVDIYTTLPSTGRGSWQVIGGTSAAAPMWAGIIALADQGRAVAGKTSLIGNSQTLPALYSTTTRGDFHDITIGNNGYPAGPGYDLDTGLGTPMVFNVVRDLLAVANATTSTTSYSPPNLTAPGTGTPGASHVDLALTARADNAPGAASATSASVHQPAHRIFEKATPTVPVHRIQQRIRIDELARTLAFDAQAERQAVMEG